MVDYTFKIDQSIAAQFPLVIEQHALVGQMWVSKGPFLGKSYQRIAFAHIFVDEVLMSDENTRLSVVSSAQFVKQLKDIYINVDLPAGITGIKGASLGTATMVALLAYDGKMPKQWPSQLLCFTGFVRYDKASAGKSIDVEPIDKLTVKLKSLKEMGKVLFFPTASAEENPRLRAKLNGSEFLTIETIIALPVEQWINKIGEGIAVETLEALLYIVTQIAALIPTG